MSVREYSQEEYDNDFSINKRGAALEHALDIRKFEIELYWKRATYFWTFIGATFAGFIAVQASSSSNRQDLSIMLSCLGLVFSFAWFCVNRGSKHWQENWEKHVDLLEDEVTGPLYKVVLSRRNPNTIKGKVAHLISGPSPVSVTKINQIISLYISFLWLGVLCYALPSFDLSAKINWFYTVLIIASFVTCILFLKLGRSYSDEYSLKAEIRSTEVKNG